MNLTSQNIIEKNEAGGLSQSGVNLFCRLICVQEQRAEDEVRGYFRIQLIELTWFPFPFEAFPFGEHSKESKVVPIFKNISQLSVKVCGEKHGCSF